MTITVDITPEVQAELARQAAANGRAIEADTNIPSELTRETPGARVAAFLRKWFAGWILTVTESIAKRWGHLAATAKQQGFALAVVDGIIAATALEHSLMLVTRNVNDFAGLGVVLRSPSCPAESCTVTRRPDFSVLGKGGGRACSIYHELDDCLKLPQRAREEMAF
jgi:hypothetical protein